MKKEMKMMPNGNYEEVISPIQHQCYSDDKTMRITEYGWSMGKLIIEIEVGDPYEDGFGYRGDANYCPVCGYQAKS